MSLFEQLNQELNEAVQGNWNLDDVVPVSLPKNMKPGKGSSGQETKVIGKQRTEQPPKEPGQGQEQEQGDQKDQDKKPGQGQGQEQGDDEENIEQGQGASPKKTKGQDQIDKGGQKGQGGDRGIYDTLDDHSKIEEGDGTGKSIIEQVYNEVEADYQRQLGQGSGAGSLLQRIKNFLKEDFDVSKILSRIGTFKRKISEYIKRIGTYQASLFNPVTHQGDILAKGNPSLKFKQRKSALLFLGADTSGSISEKDFESIAGYLNSISKQFDKKQHGIDGETYVIEWDTKVHGIKKWKNIPPKPSKDLTDKEREQLSFGGGGGTDIQGLFDWLDKKFVQTIDGKDYFVFGDEKTKDIDTEKDQAIQIKQVLKTKENYQDIDWKEGFQGVSQGSININQGGFSNVPFLLIYTDGYFNPPNIAKSKLYRNNPGNILYIVTSRGGIQNVRPKNYIFHDVHGEDE